MPTQEYMEMIARKLDAFKKFSGNSEESSNFAYKIPSFEEQVGQTALNYLKNKQNQEKTRDPLFKDHNTY